MKNIFTFLVLLLLAFSVVFSIGGIYDNKYIAVTSFIAIIIIVFIMILIGLVSINSKK